VFLSISTYFHKHIYQNISHIYFWVLGRVITAEPLDSEDYEKEQTWIWILCTPVAQVS
jgi:hypothetical protein